ncbi:MAG: hypothetical protein GY906_27295 [bacterium]|nr:hypothetical protein [bacterium]
MQDLRVDCGIVSLADRTAEDILRKGCEQEEHKCFSSGLIGPTEFSRLALLMDVSGMGAIGTGFKLLAGESQEGPWVISFPLELESAMRLMDSRERREVALLWAESEDVAGVEPDGGFEQLLGGIAGFLGAHQSPFALHVVQLPGNE